VTKGGARIYQVAPELAAALNGLVATYDHGYVASDPIRYPHSQRSRADREIVAYLSATLAFGRVAAIFRSVDALLARLGPHPAAVVRSLTLVRARRLTRGFRHRWVGSEDMAQLLRVLARFLADHGTLEEAFADGDPGGPTVRAAVAEWAYRGRTAVRGTPGRGLRFLFPTPSQGSACKRMNLFLRWVARPVDGVDLGLWKAVHPSRLVVPLDTHVAFMGKVLGLTTLKTPGWPMAEEITASLRTLDANDPVKYDWSLSRLGILGHCPEHREPKVCPSCPVYAHCQL